MDWGFDDISIPIPAVVGSTVEHGVFHHDITNEKYHSMKEYISASNIKDLLNEPYLYFHPVYREHNYNFDIGSAIHCLILEPQNFYRDFTVAPAVDLRTTIGKKTFKEFNENNAGKIIIKQEDHLWIEALAKSTRAIPEINALLSLGFAEASMFKEIEVDGVTYKVKCRPDWFIPERNIIIDVKSCLNSSPRTFKKDIAKYGYHIQSPWYKNITGASHFIFLAVEKKPPFMVGLYELIPADEELGFELCTKALKVSLSPENYTSPLRKSIHGDIVQSITLPTWVHYENEDI